jgi:hypothetical protein
MASLEPDIEILENGSVLSLSLGEPADQAALEIEHAVNRVHVAVPTDTLNRVRHHYQVHWHDILQVHREDTIDAREERLWVRFDVLSVVLEHVFEGG